MGRPPESWLEEEICGKIEGRDLEISWVRGDSGVKGNEAADRRAKEEVYAGERMGQSDLATPPE